uniref:Uncharacterized protein n=1 Tax=Cacopsylla melanoneura TaxID=428564 RepID=A0A8D9BGC1_9HEMI
MTFCTELVFTSHGPQDRFHELFENMDEVYMQNTIFPAPPTNRNGVISSPGPTQFTWTKACGRLLVCHETFNSKSPRMMSTDNNIMIMQEYIIKQRLYTAIYFKGNTTRR